MKVINFATFNIGGGIPYEKTNEYNNPKFDTVQYLADIIVQNKLDIVCFQEILMADEKNTSMSEKIAKKTGLLFYKELPLSESHIVKGRKMGISIISKTPVIFDEVFMLENPRITKMSKTGELYKSHEKGFLIIKVQIDTDELCCVTGHCIPYHTFGKDVMEYKYIYSRLESKLLQLLSENDHIIIGADFNTTRLSLLMPKVFKKYNSIINVPTRPNGRADDYILCNKNTLIMQVRIIDTCFDHYGCMATVRE